MADALKILGSLAPAAATSTLLYAVPASTSTTISSITVCNTSATATSFRISVAAAGATLATNQYVYYDQSIDGNSTYTATIGITLAATDVVRVYATLATLSFNAFGVEVA
jgi:hypothetical protein